MSVDLRTADGVAVLTLNRPERKNAFDRAQYDALAGRLETLAADDEVRVVVLTGHGTAFSSGQDLTEMARLAERAASDPTTDGDGSGFTVLLDALGRFDKPLLAAVNGVAVGIGMTLLPYCDIVVVAESARLRVPFSELGVPPEAASSLLFPVVLGWPRAAELLLTSRWITAAEAVEYGLALEICPDSRVLERTSEIAADIASKSAYSTRTIKRLMVAARLSAISEARRREEGEFARLFRSGGHGR